MIGPFDGGTGRRMPRQDHCPGASIRVNRDEYHAYRRGGIRWVDGPDELPHDGGRGDARVKCSDWVARSTVKGTETIYGLCDSCSVFEHRHRSTMRDLAKAAGGGR